MITSVQEVAQMKAWGGSPVKLVVNSHQRVKLPAMRTVELEMLFVSRTHFWTGRQPLIQVLSAEPEAVLLYAMKTAQMATVRHQKIP
mmetsp:Transcript_23294/g.41015  ORF Transcript_23294/g.41015 Transcript_23294/m.41015 type:complete len:87 (+) Transcript_23294:370-630(+)